MFQKPVAQPLLYRPGGVDVGALERALRKAVRGEVRFDAGSRALYASDASHYRQVPIGVVIPRSVDDVIATTALCHRFHAPLLSRGAGSSLCGQACNVAVVMDFSKYLHRILAIDVASKTARVEPGVVLDDLRRAARRHGLTFAPDPASHGHTTLGGMIGNNACGPHSVMAGETSDNVRSLEILTYDGCRLRVGPTDEAAFARHLAAGGREGDLYRRLRDFAARHADEIRAGFAPRPRRVSGYNLPPLLAENGFDVARALVGSEGTCVVILEAELRLVAWPAARSLLVLGYPSVFEAADHVPQVLRAGPIALEGIDERLLADMRASALPPQDITLLPPGQGWLLVEFGGRDQAEAEGRARQLMDELGRLGAPPGMQLYDDAEAAARVWRVCEAGRGASAQLPGRPLARTGWEDSSVPPARLGEYLRELRALFAQYGYAFDLYGHFGQGGVHARIDFDLETAAGIHHYRQFLHAAAHLVARFGGAISGGHGDGQAKAELLPILYGPALMDALREFKAIWDPQRQMNPGKLIDAYCVDENLRLGTAYSPPVLATAFAYTSDQGDFARSLLRCVGVGECRRREGLMCPSYRATGEEMHSTRGRARLLFEMLRGETLTGGWREPMVKAALDLCLSCKGCKGECPAQVDMAIWKAEFLSHYYAGRLRPPAAYAFGLIDRWARLAAHLPRSVNFLSGHQPFAGLARQLLGIAPERPLPLFATATFRRRFRPHAAPRRGPPLVLWPDTFNNHFHPEVLEAAAEVLEGAGFEVRLPAAPLCCGRPLYESGMLARARRYLLRVLQVLDEEIRCGLPVVVLEPACLSVFREEMPQLLPGNVQARRLAGQVFLLAEFLQQRAGGHDFGTLGRQALVHAHCHQRALFKLDAEEALLRKLGLDYRIPETGCCGMAGSFGFAKDRYAVSLRCAERALLPAVRAASADTLILADGYSCREQIVQGSGRKPLHLAEVLRMAMESEAP